MSWFTKSAENKTSTSWIFFLIKLQPQTHILLIGCRFRFSKRWLQFFAKSLQTSGFSTSGRKSETLNQPQFNSPPPHVHDVETKGGTQYWCKEERRALFILKVALNISVLFKLITLLAFPQFGSLDYHPHHFTGNIMYTHPIMVNISQLGAIILRSVGYVTLKVTEKGRDESQKFKKTSAEHVSAAIWHFKNWSCVLQVISSKLEYQKNSVESRSFLKS